MPQDNDRRLPDSDSTPAVVRPSAVVAWQLGKDPADNADAELLGQSVQFGASVCDWKAPKRTVYFFADPHADADAFMYSLRASGAIKDNPAGKLSLTKRGKDAVFVIGGDCLDKGPSNLELLRKVRQLIKTGAAVKILAGNHDVRLLMGLRAMKLKSSPQTDHLFVRMGAKVMPLFREVFDLYLRDNPKALASIPDADTCRTALFPSAEWFSEFPLAAAERVSEEAIRRELERMRKKMDSFEKACANVGLTLREVYAAALHCRKLFLSNKGEFSWFFRDMQLAYKSGSYLFIHAGLDDKVVQTMAECGLGGLNREYRKLIKNDLFDFYYGPLANTMRTKYRAVDLPFTNEGVVCAYQQGIHAVVHGHRNRHNGQRLMLRQGMLHIESDTTMDRNSRKKEGLDGIGYGVTIVHPQGQVIGISADYPAAKVFEPASYLQQG
ncbi:metallophosphoesterase [Zhongshania borealis]|uniref:Calcineurin-like phosphoesterase domain-containing protein n=1 Tax=Zhongshania borealis TaxID=889488 RepID=A0ABP7WNU2_9GAMM